MTNEDDVNFPSNNLYEIAYKHHEWLQEMGYTKATPLESLALICSEIGEAVNECRGDKPTDKLPEELADIILRSLGLASCLNIDIVKAINDKIKKNRANGTKGRVI